MPTTYEATALISYGGFSVQVFASMDEALRVFLSSLNLCLLEDSGKCKRLAGYVHGDEMEVYLYG